MREILYGDEKRGLQEALRGESKVREVLEELFNDEGKLQDINKLVLYFFILYGLSKTKHKNGLVGRQFCCRRWSWRWCWCWC